MFFLFRVYAEKYSPPFGGYIRVFTRVMSRSDGRKTAQEPPFSPTEHNMTNANFKIIKKVRS